MTGINAMEKTYLGNQTQTLQLLGRDVTNCIRLGKSETLGIPTGVARGASKPLLATCKLVSPAEQCQDKKEKEKKSENFAFLSTFFSWGEGAPLHQEILWQTCSVPKITYWDQFSWRF